MTVSAYDTIASKKPDYNGVLWLSVGTLVLLAVISLVFGGGPGGEALILIAGGGPLLIAVFSWKQAASTQCPSCKEKIRLLADWDCCLCQQRNHAHFFTECKKCSAKPVALLCPYCSSTLILTTTAEQWDAALVDKHTIRFAGITYKESPPSQPETPSAPPPDVEDIVKEVYEGDPFAPRR